jgi:integrase/recombinase XerD
MTGAKKPQGSAQDRALVDSFLDMMSAERGASPNTLDAYRRDILDFAGSCARSHTSLKEASRNHIRSYLEALAAATLKPSSQARKLSALRRFYAFLYADGIRRDDPCGAVEAPRLSRPLPKILSADEALKLIEAARGEGTEDTESARLLCIVEMLYASGLRISELVTLPLSCVRANQRFVHVRGKGGRERLAPLGAARIFHSANRFCRAT